MNRWIAALIGNIATAGCVLTATLLVLLVAAILVTMIRLALGL